MNNNSKICSRKLLRLKEYDYSQNGMYFITICTKDRRNILSRIENEENESQTTVGVAAHGDPNIELTNYGIIVKTYIENIERIYEGIFINQYIIMPNHIHMIIQIDVGWSPWAATTTIPKIINSFKTITSKKVEFSLWQRNYYEHIIRNEKELFEIQKYILENPLKWKLDKYYEKGRV